MSAVAYSVSGQFYFAGLIRGALCELDINGDIDEYGSGSSARGDVERFADGARKFGNFFDDDIMFCDRSCETPCSLISCDLKE